MVTNNTPRATGTLPYKYDAGYGQPLADTNGRQVGTADDALRVQIGAQKSNGMMAQTEADAA